jgi:hypothetical protein
MTASAAAAPAALETPDECPIAAPEPPLREMAERVARLEAELAAWRLTDEQVRGMVGG